MNLEVQRKVIIWGIGYYANYVYKAIDSNKVQIVLVVDADVKKQGNLWNGHTIESPSNIESQQFDYIILTQRNWTHIYDCVKTLVQDISKVICFWNLSQRIDSSIFLAENELALNMWEETRRLEYKLDSLPYELKVKPVPIIKDGITLLDKMIKEKKSLVRFGDGEFEIMRGNNRAWFQCADNELSIELKKVLESQHENVIVAIAQDFYSLDELKEEFADGIRDYMSEGTREAIIKMLDLNRVYYDAYVSRPYLIYKEKKNAETIFLKFKEIWEGRNICIVEGEHNRFGIGNDLISNARQVERISCPSKDSWSKYNDILHFIVGNIENDTLVLISLGPTATVLAYELACKGYQAIDVGQLDNEYDWFQMNAKTRQAIPGKMVAEYKRGEGIELNMSFEMQYMSELIGVIR